MGIVDKYIQHGFKLTEIQKGKKAPSTPRWNVKGNHLRNSNLLTGGIGLLHAYSGTMALDIDDYPQAAVMLRELGVDIRKLAEAPDSVMVWSGKENSIKYIYKMPFGLVLPTHRVSKNGKTIYELRCGTTEGLSVQDILPPTVHPETMRQYIWMGNGHWTRIPHIPIEVLEIWNTLMSVRTEIETPEDFEEFPFEWGDVERALDHISSDCTRDEWIKIGMGLKWCDSRSKEHFGFEFWDKWSSTSEKYPGKNEMVTQWKSFKQEIGNVITVKSIFHIANFNKNYNSVKDFFKNKPVTLATAGTLNAVRPNAPDVPLDQFPQLLQDRVVEISRSVGCDPLVPLWAALATVCGAVDARTRLELVPGFEVPPLLWLMVIGNPAAKKTPASRPLMGVLKDIEKDKLPEYKQALIEWESLEAIHSSQYKRWLEWRSKPELQLTIDDPGHPGELPPQPVPFKITVSDITSQALVRSASKRPRGLLCKLDEMNSWVKKMIDRNSIEDRSAWVQAYESDSYEMNRVGDDFEGKNYCENLAVAIYGNIQPAVYRTAMTALSSDGLLQRFIPAVLRNKKWGIGDPHHPQTSKSHWEHQIKLIGSLPITKYKLSQDAFHVFRNFQEWYDQRKHDEVMLNSSNIFLGAFGKLEGTVGRLALILHLIESPFKQEVSGDLMQRVVQITRKFILPSYRYALGGYDDSESFDNQLQNYILEISEGASSISMQQIKISQRKLLERLNVWQQDQLILVSMELLEQNGWVARTDKGENEHQHKAFWAINPKLKNEFAKYRKEMQAAKRRFKDEMEELNSEAH